LKNFPHIDFKNLDFRSGTIRLQPEIKDGSDEIERTTQGVKKEHKPELDSAIIDELMKGCQRPENTAILKRPLQ